MCSLTSGAGKGSLVVLVCVVTSGAGKGLLVVLVRGY